MTTEQTWDEALLVLPRLRVQNANTISSPMTWGFPAITAFTGLMTALERRLGPGAGIAFYSVGVVCHGFEPQVTQGGYTRSFHLTRNPVLQDGRTAAIAEEGRIHLDITLVFEVELTREPRSEAELVQLAAHIGEVLAGMRVAGGSVVPPLPGKLHNPPRPSLVRMPITAEARREKFHQLRRRWLPGFALVSRDDLLQARLAELQLTMPGATLLDAWIDLLRLNHGAVRKKMVNGTGDTVEAVEWATDGRPGWIVPIPVGFAALSALHDPRTVSGARDPHVPFRFVESVYSIGQWISPHRLTNIGDLVWEPDHNPASGLYRCVNKYQAPSSFPVSHTN